MLLDRVLVCVTTAPPACCTADDSDSWGPLFTVESNCCTCVRLRVGCWVTRAGNDVEEVECVGGEEVKGVESEEVEGVGSDAGGILLALAAKPLGVLLGTRPCHCLTRFFIRFASFRLVAASFRRTVLTCFPSRVA